MIKGGTLVAFFLFLAAITLSSAQRKEDEVFQIPDQENIKNLSSKWYSGYLNVTKYKKLHYIFIESLNKPETDPIIIIFNGGPGSASTFLAFTLIGPYTITGASKNLSEFPVTWARNASLLFVDNPAGVGFSYAQRDPDYITNDISNNKDLISFLFQFYSFWPSRTSNPLYISGVSYGGIYAPMVAWGIHNSNQEVDMNVSSRPRINLKGFIVANGMTDFDKDPYIGTAEEANAHNIIPNEIYDMWHKKGCKYQWQRIKVIDPEPCPQLGYLMGQRLNEVDTYNLRKALPISTTMTHSKDKRFDIKYYINDFIPLKMMQDISCQIIQTEENQDMDLFSYFNTPDFRKAFHVYEGVGPFQRSSRKILQQFKSQAEASSWIYDILAKYGYRTLHIMSDTDGFVTMAGTWKWIKDRKFTVKTPWTPWFSKYDGQLAGFFKQYNQNFTFATIHGEGHGGALERWDLGPEIILKFVLGESLA